MNGIRRQMLNAAAAALALGASHLPAPVHGASPSKPVRIIVGFPAGGTVGAEQGATDGEGRFQRLRADACVLAMGSLSPRVSAPLGIRLPIYPSTGRARPARLDPQPPPRGRAREAGLG